MSFTILFDVILDVKAINGEVNILFNFFLLAYLCISQTEETRFS